MKVRKSQPRQEADYGRRQFILDASITASLAWISPGMLFGCDIKSAAATDGADVMDDALERLTGLAPLTNHGPMAAEALIALGCMDRVIPFVESYKGRFASPYPGRVASIDRQNWRQALGAGNRVADWFHFFQTEFKESTWQQLLDRWSGLLAGGLSAAAAHGLIRTAHAVRSLSVKETELRRNELAEGLAYWAAYYQKLPEKPAIPNALRFKPAEAIRHVPLLPSEKRRSGSIMIGLTSLHDFPPFASVVDLIDITGNPDQLISSITETFAHAYLKNVAPHNFITLIHAVTGTTALRTLLPFVSAVTMRKLLRYGWQLAAGLYSISKPEIANQQHRPATADIKGANLIDRAVTSLEEHAIKFTEACLREHKLNPNPVYLQAAADAVARLR
jgi:hypothetical protein